MRLILALIATLIVAVAVGVGLYYIDSLGFYFVVMMPLLAGAVVGGTAGLVGGRSAVVGLILVAVVGALLAMGVYWGAQYIAYRITLTEAYLNPNSSATQQEAAARIELPDLVRYALGPLNADQQEAAARIELLEQRTYGVTGPRAFLAALAEQGLSISRSTSSSGGIELKDNLAYGYWILELVIAVGFAAFSAVNRRGKTKTA